MDRRVRNIKLMFYYLITEQKNLHGDVETWFQIP